MVGFWDFCRSFFEVWVSENFVEIFMIFEILNTLGCQVVDLCATLAPSTANARSPRLKETILPRVLDTRVSMISEINCGIS